MRIKEPNTARWGVALIASLLVLLSLTPVSANSITDVPEWSKRFAQAALEGDASAMGDRIDEASDPRLSMSSIRQAVINFSKIHSKHQGTYYDELNNEKIGTSFQRVTTMVMYTNQPLFYTITFMREYNGWNIVNVSMNTDVNKVLNMEWLR